MSYFPDLSPNSYRPPDPNDPLTLNFGWLNREHPFETSPPQPWLIKKLWAHCRFAVRDTRGHHDCDLPRCSWRKRIRFTDHGQFMKAERVREIYASGQGFSEYPTAQDFIDAQKKEKYTYLKDIFSATIGGHTEQLGTAQIRVFGPGKIVYAAPDLVFHYVRDHHYKPPDEVIEALRTGPCPPEKEWFARLRRISLELSWCQTMRRIMDGKFDNEMKKFDVFAPPTRPVPWIPETLHPDWGRPKKPKHRTTAAPKHRTTDSSNLSLLPSFPSVKSKSRSKPKRRLQPPPGKPKSRTVKSRNQ